MKTDEGKGSQFAHWQAEQFQEFYSFLFSEAFQ